ncbi:asparaginyl-tRNA synthetase [Suhomyces tanzawaensis NRRL Y-17324]|uniref:Asparagine--tRNA ligase, mitochondrial n=1 Tax=Suhomyces tanzawaensis NRRL Y-17324 TaxID=984487 RepID=A0A1E4SFM7_9ASCO|nr:asparaginyl-tRNA synthetase [Suhomyces tanzawaensis NRRL Y-17324]ODV78317.1 asparaginyl-tRNA synthetase [Suhomyces tanzawaensis NRRL Y-17324]
MLRSLHTAARTNLAPTIKHLLENPPTASSLLTCNGHIKSIRHSKNAGFIDLSDGSNQHSLSVVFKSPLDVLAAHQLKVGQSISVKGSWIESKGSQDYELVFNPLEPDHAISIIGDVGEDYPIQKKLSTFQHLRNFPTFRHRTATLGSMLRFRSVVESKLMDFFNSQDFTKVVPPLITSSDCEGAGEQFKVESLTNSGKGDSEENYFFGKPSYLTVSTQLHLEVLALSLNRAWTLTPCFRAEVSNTNRHLSEFWMLEAEMCYVDDVHQLTAFSEKLVKYITNELRNGAGEDLLNSRFSREDVKIIKARWDSILDKEWPTITYTEAIEIINRVMNKGRLKNRLQWGDSIQTPHEKWLAGVHFNSPVFITDYPASEKPFYMPKSKNYESERPTVACYDLILPEIGELIGGSVREHRYDELLAEMKARGMNHEDMEWYLSTRAHGSVPHGGFGLGFERLLAYLGGMENIKDVIPFPRVPQSCSC